MGSARSLVRLAEQLGRPLNQLHNLSTRRAWAHRLDSFEQHTANAFLERLAVEQARVMAAQHLDAGEKAGMAAAALTLEDFESLDPKDKIVAWKTVRGEQRASAGIATAAAAGPTVNVSTQVSVAVGEEFDAGQVLSLVERTLITDFPDAWQAVLDRLLDITSASPARRRTILGELSE